jgi:hypothetical protein
LAKVAELDYEVASDEDWEEEPEGEDLSAGPRSKVCSWVCLANWAWAWAEGRTSACTKKGMWTGGSGDKEPQGPRVRTSAPGHDQSSW